METSSADFIKHITEFVGSTTALVIAITGLIASIPPLVKPVIELIKKISRRSDDQQGQGSTRMQLGWPAVLALCVLAGALSILGARVFTHAPPLSPNAKLAKQAFEALDEHKYRQALQTASDCVDQFEGQADAEQDKLISEGVPIPPVGNVEGPPKALLLGRGVLNDVGACLFVEAQAAEKMNKVDQARSRYEKLSKLTYARVYDPRGPFFWSPADAASARLKKLTR